MRRQDSTRKWEVTRVAWNFESLTCAHPRLCRHGFIHPSSLETRVETRECVDKMAGKRPRTVMHGSELLLYIIHPAFLGCGPTCTVFLPVNSDRFLLMVLVLLSPSLHEILPRSLSHSLNFFPGCVDSRSRSPDHRMDGWMDRHVHHLGRRKQGKAGGSAFPTMTSPQVLHRVFPKLSALYTSQSILLFRV